MASVTQLDWVMWLRIALERTPNKSCFWEGFLWFNSNFSVFAISVRRNSPQVSSTMRLHKVGLTCWASARLKPNLTCVHQHLTSVTKHTEAAIYTEIPCKGSLSVYLRAATFKRLQNITICPRPSHNCRLISIQPDGKCVSWTPPPMRFMSSWAIFRNMLYYLTDGGARKSLSKILKMAEDQQWRVGRRWEGAVLRLC
jgi:hypothetical protein